jgi:hypothetical protein
MKQREKKPRLKVKRPGSEQKKRKYTFWEYLIFGVGGIAAVVVAVWGGYYLGRQTANPQLTPEIQSVINRIQILREKGGNDNLEIAEKMLTHESKKHPGNELLALNLARVYIDKNELAKADELVHSKLHSVQNRRIGLKDLREGYRKNGMSEATVLISKELVKLENDNLTPTPSTASGT